MIVNRNGRRKGPRRGFTLAEVAISAFVLVVAMGITVKVLGWIGTEHRASDRRQWAIQTASNVMERITAEPFDRVNVEHVKEFANKTDAAKALPGAEWTITVDDDREGPVPGRRVALRLRWKERSDIWVAPVRLTAWVYRQDQGVSK